MIKARVSFRSGRVKWLSCVLIVAGTIAVLLSYGQASRHPTTASAEQWIQLNSRPITIRLELVGRIISDKLLIITAPFAGNVEEIPVTEGERVSKGQPLLTLQTTQLDIELRQAFAELLKARRAVQDLETWADSADVRRANRAHTTARLNLRDTERKLAETRILFTRGIVPRMELDALEQQAKLLRLDLEATKLELQTTLARGEGANRQLANMELENATAKYDTLARSKERRQLTAAFPGVIVSPPSTSPNVPAPPLQIGTLVTPGQALLGLASVGQVKATAKVDEIDINQLRQGQNVEIRGDGFEGIILRGQIESVGVQRINSNADAGATYEIVVNIPPLTSQQQTHIRLGMSARISVIVYHHPDGYVVPPTAISTAQGKSFVIYREQLDRLATRVPVKTGRSTPAGVEVFGLHGGYIRLLADNE